MYKSLANKVFWLFAPLAIVTIIFGVFIYYGQSTIEESNAKINLLKDFQFQLKHLETMHPHSIYSGGTGSRSHKNFEKEIKKTEKMANSIVLIHSDISPQLLTQLEKIPFFMNNFSRAYQELFDLFVLDKDFPKKNAELLEMLHKESETAGVNKKSDNYHLLHYLFQEMMTLQIDIYHNRQITTLPELKKIIIQIKSKSTNPTIHSLVHNFVTNIETNYINYLQIKSREEFLQDTSNRFFQIATDTIETIRHKNKKTQLLFIWTIFGFTFTVILINLISWLWSSTYINKFLKNQQHAMAALENENYDFTLPSLPEDEIGELTRAMQTLAGNFKKSLHRLKMSDKKYRDLVENLSDWIWEVDEKGRYTYASEAVKKLLGYSPTEIIGKRPFDLMSDEEAARMEKIFSTHLRNKESFSECKNINLHKEGHEVILETSAQPIFDENGILRGYRGIDRDITGRELAVKEQTRLEEQLNQAQKLESIGRLAGGVAHDFNNILSAINGYAELSLLKMDQDNPFRKEMATILESGQRAARLTQQLLAFSRKQIIKQEHLNINNELKETSKMLIRLLGEDIEIETSYDEELWPVKVDRSQLEQVIINLAINARDAMPTGGKLTIETTNIVLEDRFIKKHYNIKAGNYTMLAISDNGQGMSDEVLEHIFEPFFTTKDMTKGTGLGLATVYGIIKQNGGEINVYSEPGKGTSFTIYFPKAEGNNNKQDSSQTPQAPTPSGTETILLVEDDELVRNLSSDILTNQGYTVLVARDGMEALDSYHGYQGNINLLLTDVVMPKMGGTELAEKIREMNPDIHILFMSGYTENSIVNNGILKSGVNFLNKPITPQLLAENVRKLLDS